MIEDLRFTYNRNRCDDCGTFFAIESDRNIRFPLCPICGRKDIEAANRRLDKLERSNRGLRGALKAKKK